jgi:hypothetical protein
MIRIHCFSVKADADVKALELQGQGWETTIHEAAGELRITVDHKSRKAIATSWVVVATK